MSGQYLNAITENASRLGMRLQESFSEHTRDLTIARGSSAAYLDNSDDKTKDIRKQLDSNSDREKLDAMKRLVALISKNRNVSEYFAQVVKNVASANLEIRKLVYIYLLRYAEQEPDLALLSINTFQKDLADGNPVIRAMALRVLSGIKVPMIASIVVLAIKKCAADTSPYVRKAAAFAIPKCYELDTSQLPALITIITTILKDRSSVSIGSVVVAFEAVCPTRLDLIHQQYRRLCKILVEVDEWGQVDLLNLLLRYVRTMLPRPSVKRGGDGMEEEVDLDVKLLLDAAEPVFQSRNPAVVMAAARVFYYAAPPSYLGKIVQPLLRLLNTSKEVERVVLVYLFVISRFAPNLFTPFYTRFLVRTDDSRQVKKEKIKLLLNVLTTDNYPAILREFVDYAEDPDDQIVAAAIRAVGRCAYLISGSAQHCLAALITMIKSPYDIVISNAVLVLKGLVQTQLSTSSPAAVISQAPISIVAHLAQRIDDIKHAQARACVIWLVGQYAKDDSMKSSSNDNITTAGKALEGVAEWAPDVLRKAAKSFGEESPIVKLQIVTLASKLLVLSPTDRTLGLLSRYVFSLARYDTNYDVRDRARMMTSLLAGVAPVSMNGGDQSDEESQRSGVILRTEQVRLVLFEGKSGVVDTWGEGQFDENKVLVGSLSAVTGRSMLGDTFLPDWLENGVEGSLRDNLEDNAPIGPVVTAIGSVSGSGGQRAIEFRGPRMGAASPVVLTPTGESRPSSSAEKGAWKDLDKFYEAAPSEESEGEEEDDDDDDGEDDGEEEDDSSDEEGSGQEEDEEEVSVEQNNTSTTQEESSESDSRPPSSVDNQHHHLNTESSPWQTPP